MSVIPLTAAIQDGLAPDLDRTEQEPLPERPGGFNSDAFDRVYNDAVEKVEKALPKDDAKPAERKSLDALIGEGLNKVEAAEADHEEWQKSRESRAELQERYGRYDATPAKTLDLFLGWHDAFKRDPRRAGDQFAQSYIKAGPYALTERSKPEAKDYSHLDERTALRAKSNDKLNALLEDATDSATTERKDFEATAAQRKQLKEIFPGLSFDQALAKVVEIDRDAHRDPVGVAGALAAQYGMPITDGQRQHAQWLGNLSQVMQQHVATLPGFDEARVAAILHDKNFKHSPDPRDTLNRAHAITQAEDRLTKDIESHITTTLAGLEPAVAAEVDRVVRTDPTIRAAVAKSVHGDPIAPRVHLAQAVEIARGNVARAKAKRAMPIKTGSTHSPGNSSRDLDSIISNAIGAHG